MNKYIFSKKLFLLSIIFILSLLALCGCGNTKGKFDKLYGYNIEDFGMHDATTNTTVYLNDSQSTVEKYWGKPDEVIFDNDTVRYDYLMVIYDKNHNVCRFILDKVMYDGKHRFEISSGIGCDSTVVDFQQMYKEYTEEKDKFNRYVSTIELIQKDSHYEPYNEQTEKSKEDKEQNRIYVSMLYYDHTNIDKIQLGKSADR